MPFSLLLNKISTLRERSFPLSLKGQISFRYHSRSLDILENLLAIEDSSLRIESLEEFLYNNWFLIQGSFCAYTACPQDELTLLLIEVAKIVQASRAREKGCYLLRMDKKPELSDVPKNNESLYVIVNQSLYYLNGPRQKIDKFLLTEPALSFLGQGLNLDERRPITEQELEFITSITGQVHKKLNLYEILMPGLNLTSMFPETYPDLDELEIEKVLTTHILGKEGLYLIPLRQLLSIDTSLPFELLLSSAQETQAYPIEAKFNNYYNMEDPRHLGGMDELSLDECHRLYQHSELARSLFAARKEYHQAEKANANFLFYLDKLCCELQHNSSHGGIGQTMQAASGAFSAVVDFFDYYHKLFEEALTQYELGLSDPELKQGVLYFSAEKYAAGVLSYALIDVHATMRRGELKLEELEGFDKNLPLTKEKLYAVKEKIKELIARKGHALIAEIPQELQEALEELKNLSENEALNHQKYEKTNDTCVGNWSRCLKKYKEKYASILSGISLGKATLAEMTKAKFLSIEKLKLKLAKELNKENYRGEDGLPLTLRLLETLYPDYRIKNLEDLKTFIGLETEGLHELLKNSQLLEDSFQVIEDAESLAFFILEGQDQKMALWLEKVLSFFIKENDRSFCRGKLIPALGILEEARFEFFIETLLPSLIRDPKDIMWICNHEGLTDEKKAYFEKLVTSEKKQGFLLELLGQEDYCELIKEFIPDFKPRLEALIANFLTEAKEPQAFSSLAYLRYLDEALGSKLFDEFLLKFKDFHFDDYEPLLELIKNTRNLADEEKKRLYLWLKPQLETHIKTPEQFVKIFKTFGYPDASKDFFDFLLTKNNIFFAAENIENFGALMSLISSEQKKSLLEGLRSQQWMGGFSCFTSELGAIFSGLNQEEMAVVIKAFKKYMLPATCNEYFRHLLSGNLNEEQKTWMLHCLEEDITSGWLITTKGHLSAALNSLNKDQSLFLFKALKKNKEGLLYEMETLAHIFQRHKEKTAWILQALEEEISQGTLIKDLSELMSLLCALDEEQGKGLLKSLSKVLIQLIPDLATEIKLLKGGGSPEIHYSNDVEERKLWILEALKEHSIQGQIIKTEEDLKSLLSEYSFMDCRSLIFSGLKKELKHLLPDLQALKNVLSNAYFQEDLLIHMKEYLIQSGLLENDSEFVSLLLDKNLSLESRRMLFKWRVDFSSLSVDSLKRCLSEGGLTLGKDEDCVSMIEEYIAKQKSLDLPLAHELIQFSSNLRKGCILAKLPNMPNEDELNQLKEGGIRVYFINQEKLWYFEENKDQVDDSKQKSESSEEESEYSKSESESSEEESESSEEESESSEEESESSEEESESSEEESESSEEELKSSDEESESSEEELEDSNEEIEPGKEKDEGCDDQSNQSKERLKEVRFLEGKLPDELLAVLDPFENKDAFGGEGRLATAKDLQDIYQNARKTSPF